MAQRTAWRFVRNPGKIGYGVVHPTARATPLAALLLLECRPALGGLIVMSAVAVALPVLSDLSLPLERDDFLCGLLRELTGTLQDVVGSDEASGFISVVSQRLGERIDGQYKAVLGLTRLTREQVAKVLVDFKRRIGGAFFVIEQSDDRIVLGNRDCPFAEAVAGRPALCMMTSNIFGVIAAENLGYAKVVLERTIAQGSPACRVVIYLRPTPQAQQESGREYFKA